MSVALRFFDDNKAVAIAGEHAVVLDRTREQGGDNSGFRARELWLASLIACASGTVKLLAREDGVSSALSAAQGELLLDAHNEIAGISLRFAFVPAISRAQQTRWLGQVSTRCLLLKTVASHITIQLQAEPPVTADHELASAPLAGSCELQGVC